MKRFLTGTALGVVASAIVATGLVTTPAQSATGWNRCPDGYLCLFTGRNGTGAMAQLKWGDSNLGDSFGPTGMNNATSSAWNRRAAVFVVYDYTGCDSAPNRNVDPGKHNFTGSWDNRITSVRYLYSRPNGQPSC